MGQFGNVLVVAGQTDLALEAKQGRDRSALPDQYRQYARFNVALPGAQMKFIGGDSGRCEQEELIDSVILARSERAVIDVLFRSPDGRRLAYIESVGDVDGLWTIGVDGGGERWGRSAGASRRRCTAQRPRS